MKDMKTGQYQDDAFSENHTDHGAMTIMKKVLLFLLGFLIATQVAAAAEVVTWRGESFTSVASLDALPSQVQKFLGVGRPGLDGASDIGGRLNTTDVVNPSLPMRRMAVAGISPKSVLVAMERSGYAYNINVILFMDIDHDWKALEKWTLSKKPKDLRGLVTSLEAKK